MKKLTIVKIGDETYNPTNEDLEKIRDSIIAGEVITTDYPTSVETVEYNDLNEFEIFCDESYSLNMTDAMNLEDIFAQIKNNSDFIIFMRYGINIQLKSKQISYCKRCNIQNEYIDFNSNWTCYSCRS